MSRTKRYYTVDEITSNLYTSGKELMKTDGTEYIGLYHRYNTGEIYSESTWYPLLSVKLVAYQDISRQNINDSRYKSLRPNINVAFFSPKSSTPKINNENIQTGIINRYFIKRYDQNTIIEISLETFNDWKNNLIDKILYTAISIKWKIKGNIEDYINTANNKVTGVKSFNQTQIKNAENKLSGITLYLTDPLQYYISNSYIKSIDINGLA